MTELISLLNELTTLEKIAKASGAVPGNITNAIDKVLSVLAASDFVRPDSMNAVLSDVAQLLGDAEKLGEIPAVQEFAKQILQLVENIRGVKVSAPASVIIKDVPPVQ